MLQIMDGRFPESPSLPPSRCADARTRAFEGPAKGTLNGLPLPYPSPVLTDRFLKTWQRVVSNHDTVQCASLQSIAVRMGKVLE
jgi:hypothetical protein